MGDGPDERIDSSAARKALTALQVAYSISRLYENPVGQPGFERALSDLEGLIAANQTFHFDVSNQGFVWNEQQLSTKDEALQRLARRLFERRAKDLTIRAAPGPEELVAFVALTLKDPGSIESDGGARAFMTSEAVTSIAVSDRELHVGATDTLDPSSGSVGRLLLDQETLATEIEATGDAALAYSELDKMLEQASGSTMDFADLFSSLADTVGHMSPHFKDRLVAYAMEQFPQRLAVGLTSQLSDGELADALLALSREKGAELAMAYAIQVVRNSNGRRGELPITVGARLIKEGFDKTAVLGTFGSDRLIGNETPGLRHQDITDGPEDLDDVEALRSEAEALDEDAGFQAGYKILSSILQGETSLDDTFHNAIKIAETSIHRFALEGRLDESVTLLELLSSQIETGPENADMAGSRTDELLRALQSGTSPEVV
ncbi:MAG: hypothetical protein LC723_12085, partial [Actinobacteria bacterium]|nr:hypothetical protein [Actinomycetota bacterium]